MTTFRGPFDRYDRSPQEGLAGWTALHMAAHRGDGRLVRHLMDKCGGVAPYVTDYAGRTPGRVAAPSVRGMFADRDDSDSDEVSLLRSPPFTLRLGVRAVLM